MNSQAEMQRAMEEIQTTLRRGLRRKNSTSSLHSIASFAVSINSKETWKKLFRDLHKAGVTAGMIRERKDQIVDFFQGSSPPVVVEEIPEFEAPSTSTPTGVNGNDDPPHEVMAEKKKRNISLKINWAPFNALTGPLLIEAVKSGDTNAVRFRLAVVGNLEYKDTNECTALYWAAAKGHRDIVQLLLEKGANTEAALDYGATALHISAQNGHPEVVKLLLDNSANIEATRHTGETALYISAQNGHLAVVKLLLDQGVNTEATRYTGETALHISACRGHLEVVKLLLAKGAVLEARTHWGETAVDVATKNGHQAVVNLLNSSLKSPK